MNVLCFHMNWNHEWRIDWTSSNSHYIYMVACVRALTHALGRMRSTDWWGYSEDSWTCWVVGEDKWKTCIYDDAPNYNTHTLRLWLAARKTCLTPKLFTEWRVHFIISIIMPHVVVRVRVSVVSCKIQKNACPKSFVFVPIFPFVAWCQPFFALPLTVFLHVRRLVESQRTSCHKNTIHTRKSVHLNLRRTLPMS